MKLSNFAFTASLQLIVGETSAKNIFLPDNPSSKGLNFSADNFRRGGIIGKWTNSHASDADCDFDLDIQLFEDSTMMTFSPDKEACKKGKSFVGATRDGKKHINLVPSHGVRGAFTASMIDDDTGVVCSISPDANGDMVVVERSQEDFEDEDDPVNPPDDDGWDVNGRALDEVVSPQAAASGLRGGSDDSNNSNNSNNSRSLQSNTNIDVLVLWTADAECSQSLRPSGCTRTAITEANIRALIDLAVEETNTAYSLSGVNAKLRLAHAAYTRYTEPGSYKTALDDLRNDNDGKMDEVHTLRNQYGADVVALIVGMAGSCGRGFIGPRRDLMFSVTRHSCATGYFSFGHEIGHNLGCNHDKGTIGVCSSANYNYGYRDPQARFRSILAYNCEAGDCDNNAGGGCVRVQRFSNNQLLYNGWPIGSVTIDNARHINNVKETVAGYYTATPATTRAPTNQPTFPPSSSAPTKAPTNQPTSQPPSLAPTKAPTKQPTSLPSSPPSQAPTKAPTNRPTFPPSSSAPVKAPTNQPTSQPPSLPPTKAPTKQPTSSPSSPPSQAPTKAPTKQPTSPPSSLAPTKAPTNQPTPQPPSLAPTKAPTNQPTSSPSSPPSQAPTKAPTKQLTSPPSAAAAITTTMMTTASTTASTVTTAATTTPATTTTTMVAPDMELSTPNRKGARTDDAKGIFFTVQAKKNIIMTGMTIVAQTNAASKVSIYTRGGIHHDNAQGWTLVYEGNIPDQKSKKYTLDDFRMGVGIAAGQTQSFYVFSKKGILYTASENEGSPYVEDNSVIVNEGRATKGWFRKPIDHSSGRFAGVIRYHYQ